MSTPMRNFCVFTLLAASALAQNPASPAFEVASVKINDGEPYVGYALKASGDTLTIRNVPFRVIVAFAYNIQWPQVTGVPWLDTARYDILAKAAKPATGDEMRPMLQTLLKERFKLEFHRETRQVEVIALTVPKTGHKMTPSKRDTVTQRQDPERGAVMEGVLLSELCENMAHERESVPVVDMTGLTGRFDFTFNIQKYRDALQATARSSTRQVTEAEMKLSFMQDLMLGELGLKLEPKRAAVELLVIDSAAQKPVEN
jgi:uncharacterized protein (TIGR03435 family)